MMPKQHRRGKKTSRKIANLKAISDYTERRFCSGDGCFAELTEADMESGECTQCRTPIPKQISLEEVLLESIQLLRRTA